MSSAGHWYGHGEAQTEDGGPYTQQPWPLDETPIQDDVFGPASYLMIDPFWFTQSAAGIWFDTRDVMAVSLGSRQAGTAGLEVQGSDSSTHTVFVERTPHAVYQDYAGITAVRTRATRRRRSTRHRSGTAGPSSTRASRRRRCSSTRRSPEAGVPGHTIQVDDGWSSHYGDFTFNDKFLGARADVADDPRPRLPDGSLGDALDQRRRGQLRVRPRPGIPAGRSKDHPTQPCQVTWWNGTAGIVDLANPDARAWFAQQLHDLEDRFGVDGFKFDIRFFDERCAPYPGHEPLDYLDLGAELADEFDQQGAGVRIHWTGSQRYGFVIRQVDKGTDWGSLQAAVAQNLAITSIGYPFVETDMIGGSLGQPTPSKQLLVRWAQAASLMPLMYSSTSPAGRTDPSTGEHEAYDQETIDLYTRAVQRHEDLGAAIRDQVNRAIAHGELDHEAAVPSCSLMTQRATTSTTSGCWATSPLAAARSSPTRRPAHVRIPPGRWYDVTRSREVRGPTTLRSYSAELGETPPVFVRLGRSESRDLMRAVAHW